ncbi:MAG: CHAP domain-containing protein [Flavobacteriales bacterium]|nr:CHAP domain-containing protein [Flavobacteriales bacterium]
MAKAKVLIIAAVGFLFVSCYAEPSHESLRDAVVNTAVSQLHVRELTGRNDGVEVEAYLKAVDRKKGDAWCAAFVSWCFQQHGVKVPRSGWSPTWFPKANIIYTRGKTESVKPRKADVIGIWFSNLNRIAHVGLVEKWGDKYVTTIEGNTSTVNEGNGTREGDGVYRKRRLTRQIYQVSSWLK